MLSGLLTLLAPLLVAILALRRLRGRRLQLRVLRSRFRETLEACEAELLRLDALEPDARVAGLAPHAPGSKPSNAEQEYISARESLRQVDESLQQAEGEWQLGHYDVMESRLSNLWAQLDIVRGGVDRLAQALAGLLPLVPPEEAHRTLDARREEEVAARAAQETEIRSRIEREVPRVLARARDRVGPGGAWADKRLAQARDAAAQAQSALDAGDLLGADRGSRRARALAGSVVHLVDSSLAIAGRVHGRSLWHAFVVACVEARVPPSFGLGWTLAAMAVSAGAGNWIGNRIAFSSTEVLTTSGNMALGAATRASHVRDAPHAATKAVDGDLTTSWQSGASLADAQALIVDLAKAKPVGKVLVLPQASPKGRCRWEIDVSETLWEWHLAGAASSSCAPGKSRWGITEIATGTRARFVRIRPVDWGRSGVAVAEVRVFAPSRIRALD